MMESTTKNRQPPHVLQAMVERAYGIDLVPDNGSAWAQELDHGWFNVVYRIRLRDGRRVVVKIAPPPDVEVLSYERGAMATELAALRLIRENTSVPVPAVDFAEESGELCGASWFFMPHIDADNLGIIKHSLPAAELEEYNALVGETTRELNSLRGSAFGPLGGPGDPSWRVVFSGMLDSVLRDGERRGVGVDYDAIRAAAAAHESSLDEIVEPRFVEWDLWDSNVMVRDGRIVCVIDHERAFYGDPLIEAGFTATQLPAFGDPAGFLRGYGRSGFTDTEVARRRLYCLYLTLVMVIESYYRGHTDTGVRDWSRARLAETMRLLDR
jgi:aminoglycoside phosphotransferase (APT) family kinase protein